MNYIRRSFLYMTNRKKQTIQIFLIFVMLSTLILTAVSVSSAARYSCREIRKQLGSTVSLRYRAGFDAETAGTARPITSAMADKLEALANVKSVDRMAAAYACAVDFLPFPGGIRQNNSATPEGDVYLSGVTCTERLSEFRSEALKLVEGRHIVDSDEAGTVVMIEKSLAEEDDIGLGDVLTVRAADSEKEAKLSVTGIYQNTSQGVLALTGQAMQKENRLYVPEGTVYRLTGEDRLEQIVMTLEDPALTEEFLKAAKHEVPIPSNCILDANDAAYRRIAGPLDNVILLGFITLLAASAAGVVILALIVMLAIRERRYEIGILLSVGERKSKILLQLLFEMLLPVLAAISISVGIGYHISQEIGDRILQNQISSVDNRSTGETASDVQVDRTLHVVPELSDIGRLYTAGVLITLLAATAPALFIVRYKPRELLIRID